ncbi:MAG: AbrB/MazE/SpoVT family DNA-binding domain-containing protein [Oscillospiraceae bacterium]|nr:AbrB/MazE/SpoVT family DNA-binding domain-containing protein [Oscillospiraceae bacterium]
MEKLIASRRIDELNRVVLPIELRRVLELQPGDRVDLLLDEASRQVILRKAEPTTPLVG